MLRRAQTPSLLVCCAALSFVTSAGCERGGPTDEELLEQFVKDVTGVVDEELLSRAVGYTALGELPIDVQVPQHQGVYRAEHADELLGSFRAEMRRHFGGSELKLLRHKLEIEGDRADIGMRLMTKRGPIQADIGLRKLAEGWRVTKVHARPSGLL